MDKFAEYEFEALAKIIDAEMNITNGKIKESKIDFNESIRLLQEAKTLNDRWIIRFYLGYAYLKSEAFTEAHSEFELCLKRRGEAFSYDESQRIPLVYYYLGQVQEALNSPAASESYQHFLEIKKKE
jgi:tetratricopeptide (TPR) repeat protein